MSKSNAEQLLLNVITAFCSIAPGVVDSAASGANSLAAEEAIRFLVDAGKLNISTDFGSRIIAESIRMRELMGVSSKDQLPRVTP